jgi:hypothetical protein
MYAARSADDSRPSRTNTPRVSACARSARKLWSESVSIGSCSPGVAPTSRREWAACLRLIASLFDLYEARSTTNDTVERLRPARTSKRLLSGVSQRLRQNLREERRRAHWVEQAAMLGHVEIGIEASDRFLKQVLGLREESKRTAPRCSHLGMAVRPGSHFVKEGAEREDIAAMIERLAFDLFGRHVRQRAAHNVFAGEAQACQRASPTTWRRRRTARQHLGSACLELAARFAGRRRAGKLVARRMRGRRRVSAAWPRGHGSC